MEQSGNEPRMTAEAADPGPGALPRRPARRLAVLTCMDSRLDPLRDLGLARGDAMVLRNAGAQMSEDVKRSLRLAHDAFGLEEVWLVAHSDCAAHRGDDDAARDELRQGVARVREAIRGVRVQLLFFDFATATATPVDPAG
jgi:carbonic anhydrase